MRKWFPIGSFVACVAISLAACGGADHSAMLEATSGLGAAGAAGATTTAAPGATGTAVTTTTDGVSTTAPVATLPPTDTVDPGPTTTAPAGAPTTTPVATTAPGPSTTVAASADRTILVQRLFNYIGYPLDDTEATCLATYTSTTVLDAISATGDAAVEGTIAASLVQALARCEPASFLQEQDSITIEDYGVDAKAARCVTKALDAAALGDATIAGAYFDGTSKLTPALQQKLISALTPCVGQAKASEIITT